MTWGRFTEVKSPPGAVHMAQIRPKVFKGHAPSYTFQNPTEIWKPLTDQLWLVSGQKDFERANWGFLSVVIESGNCIYRFKDHRWCSPIAWLIFYLCSIQVSKILSQWRPASVTFWPFLLGNEGICVTAALSHVVHSAGPFNQGDP